MIVIRISKIYVSGRKLLFRMIFKQCKFQNIFKKIFFNVMSFIEACKNIFFKDNLFIYNYEL